LARDEENVSSYRNYRPRLRIVVGEKLSGSVSVSADGSWGKGRVESVTCKYYSGAIVIRLFI
jgi:hypothetical protein